MEEVTSGWLAGILKAYGCWYYRLRIPTSCQDEPASSIVTLPADVQQFLMNRVGPIPPEQDPAANEKIVAIIKHLNSNAS